MSVNLIGYVGYYRKIPIFHDEYRQPVLIMHGSLEKEKDTGLVYHDFKSGKTYNEDGSRYRRKPPKRGIKAFIVNTTDINEAKLLIKFSLIENILNAINLE